jgi:tetratricopeptide (TPR) repeat protein
MAIHPTARTLLAALLFTAAGRAQTPPAQTPSAPAPPAAPCPAQNQSASQTPNPNQNPDQASKPCSPPAPAAKKSAAQQFPFPGEPPKPANPPDSPVPATTPSGAAAQHPFPTQTPPKLPGNDSSSSSSSSSDDDPAPTPGDTPTTGGDPPEGTSVHRRLPKVKAIKTDDERVDEDLTVARFYMNDENYQGAYLRAKEAVQIQPDYSATHFALAEIAQKMKKKDEAIAEYQAYLKLDPDGEKAKAAKKALADLQ